MKNLLGGVFTTLFLFGVGKAIYDKGAADERKKTNRVVINVTKGPFDELMELFKKSKEESE